MAPARLAFASRRAVTGRKPAVEAPIPNRIAELRERAGLSRIEVDVIHLLAVAIDHPVTVAWLTFPRHARAALPRARRLRGGGCEGVTPGLEV